MGHFSPEEWIDFVNGVASASQKLAMEKHQSDGCEPCAKTLVRWQRIRQAVAAEASYQPQEEAVRIAKAAFAGSEWAWERKAARSVTEVLFDSFLQPAREGVRSVESAARRMLYRADPYRIDFQIEAPPGGRSIIVTGQLLDLRHPENLGRNVPLMLSNLRGRVVQAKTDQWGEFREEIENSGDLELVFHGANEKPVMISLRDVLGQSLDLEE